MKAVDDITFEVQQQEVFGLIGESGCGKSTTALSIMRMLDTTARTTGKIIIGNQDILKLTKKDMRQIWGNKLFMIFQDPVASLNPIMKIKDQIAEVLGRERGNSFRNHDVLATAKQMLERVNIPDSERVLEQYPHQLSGGMKQRVMIAMGIALNPDLLLLDEPTTALDSTVQFKIVELLLKVKDRYRMSQILITHDFGVAAKLCDRIAVMYAGKIVEEGNYMTLFREPAHPYTQGLFKCIIKAKSNLIHLETMQGYLPRLNDLPQGCHFQPRCRVSMPECLDRGPSMIDLGNDHFVACHRFTS
jgi:oligopeptide/dipeptide ABC transporter ATP-binding protein